MNIRYLTLVRYRSRTIRIRVHTYFPAQSSKYFIIKLLILIVNYKNTFLPPEGGGERSEGAGFIS